MGSRSIRGTTQPLLLDGQQYVAGGMDEFTRAAMLPADAYQRGINVLVNETFDIQTRYGVQALGDEAAGANPVTGVFYYDTPSNEQVLKCVNGAFTQWNGTAWSAASGFTASTTFPIAGAQLVETLYLTDGINPWHSWNGTTFTAMNATTGPANDPPQGATLAISHAGRIFASGVAVNPDTLWASDVLDGAKWNHVNFSARVGMGEGDPITGLVSLPRSYLCVLKENSIWLGRTVASATSFNDWPFERMAVGVGCVGKQAYCVNGSDVWFLSYDGVRSLRRMQATDQEWEVSPPVSRPMQPWIDRINWAYASKAKMQRYEHLIFVSVPIDAATTNSHTLIYNLRLERWIGVWTWNVQAWCISRFGGNDRLLWGDEVGRVNEWLDYEDADEESTYLDNGAGFETRCRFRATWFGRPLSRKRGRMFEIRFVRTNNTVTLNLWLDGTEDRTWSVVSSQDLPTLPVLLPFTLGTLKPRDRRQSLLGVRSAARTTRQQPFREAFIEAVTSTGKMAIQEWSMGVFEQSLLEDAA